MLGKIGDTLDFWENDSYVSGNIIDVIENGYIVDWFDGYPPSKVRFDSSAIKAIYRNGKELERN